MSRNHPIDEHFREALQDRPVVPDPGLWSRMEPRLERKSGRPVWVMRLAASFTILLAVSTFVFDGSGPSADDSTVRPVVSGPQDFVPAIETGAPMIRRVPESAVPQEVVEETATGVEEGQVARNKPIRRNVETPEADAAGHKLIAENSAGEQGVLPKSFGQDSKVQMSVRFNPERYRSTTRDEPEPDVLALNDPVKKPTLEDYAETQFRNLMSGQDVQIPSKSEIQWPQLSVNLQPIMNKFSFAGERPLND